MACTIIEGRQIDCRDSVGGIAEIYVAEYTNVQQAAILASSGSITSMNCLPTKKFYTYQMEKGNAQFDEKAVVSVENGTLYYEQTLTFDFKKNQASLRNDFHILAQNRLLFIVKDNNGLFRLMGQTVGADMGESTNSTGKAWGDKNGYTFTFTGMEPVPANFVSQAIVTTLTA